MISLERATHVRLGGLWAPDELIVARWCQRVRWRSCASPRPTHGNTHLFGVPDACLHAPPFGGRCGSGPPPGPARVPPSICAAPAGPAAFGAERLGLQAQQLRRSRWAESGRGYAGQGLHAGHHSGQLRWCARTGPVGRPGAEGGRGNAKGYSGAQRQDDLWGDQSLEGEPGLPPGWRKIHDAAGTYYWHVPSGSTQWQRPTWELGDAENPGTETEGIWGLRPPKGRSFSSLESSLDRSNSLSWYGEESYIQSMEPGAKCFAVRSLGWVEVPEEDLAPGKSSIAVNNCIQQLAQTRSRSQPPDAAWGEGQNMLMILKKDAMSLVNPLDHSLIHCQPLVHIRVWGVGSSKGRDRDFAFVASDKDSCMLKCHVFRCDVPAKAIASVLHGLCAQILSERIGVSGDASCCSPDPISPEDLPRQVELLDAVSQAAQKYEALYMGTLPVTKAMGMDVLNEAIGALTARGDRNAWVPTTLSVSDSLMTAYPVQVQYQKCLVASAARGKAWGAQARARLRLKRTSSMDSPGGPLPLPLLKGGVGSAGATPRKRGVFSFLDAFRLKPSLLHMP
uniref:amyloid-beta A4 precursor protein-binding family B member 3 isoform X3 n=1 Tax=Callithrix jacchus TaxID=9483 RepID=UPI0023DD3B3E|nr:amyloid-beta A4 precursor protein-binding family B member 3 isoform X3 [Callithrix jacchus]